MNCDEAKDGSIAQDQIAERGLTNTGCVRQQSIEDRLKFAGRGTDDFEHVRSCGLLFQRLGKIIGALAQSLSSRVFSMAMTACAAKFVNTSICLSVNGRTSLR